MINFLDTLRFNNVSYRSLFDQSDLSHCQMTWKVFGITATFFSDIPTTLKQHATDMCHQDKHYLLLGWSNREGLNQFKG